jgi:hypothetical protein
MKNAIALLLIATTLTICGCRNSTDGPGQTVMVKETHTASSDPRDYFPTAVGTTWTYKIKATESDALFARRTDWPTSETGAIVVETRGRFFYQKKLPSYSLILQVKGKAKKQGQLQYPEGIELSVVKDELGVYRGVKQLFWAIGDNSRFEVTEVQTFSEYSSDSPFGTGGIPMGNDDGSSIRLLFFGSDPGTKISYTDKPLDSLTNLGFDGGNLCFKRDVVVKKVINNEKVAGSELGYAFSETSYYKEGVGLNQLEQTVNGKTTMTWTLEKFTPGK